MFNFLRNLLQRRATPPSDALYFGKAIKPFAFLKKVKPQPAEKTVWLVDVAPMEFDGQGHVIRSSIKFTQRPVPISQLEPCEVDFLRKSGVL